MAEKCDCEQEESIDKKKKKKEKDDNPAPKKPVDKKIETNSKADAICVCKPGKASK
jgi:hypothetical protein